MLALSCKQGTRMRLEAVRCSHTRLAAPHRSMTHLNKVFMLPADARLNQQTMRAILASGHSRIPVYTRGDR